MAHTNKPSSSSVTPPSLEELLYATFRHRLSTTNNNDVVALPPRYSSFARQTSQRQIVSILQEALDLSEQILRRGSTSERDLREDGSDDNDAEFCSEYRQQGDRPHEDD